MNKFVLCRRKMYLKSVTIPICLITTKLLPPASVRVITPTQGEKLIRFNSETQVAKVEDFIRNAYNLSGGYLQDKDLIAITNPHESIGNLEGNISFVDSSSKNQIQSEGIIKFLI